MSQPSRALASDPPPLPPPDLRQLFIAFTKVSLSGFGGVLPWARRMMVEEKRWLTADEFNESFSLAQFLPGPNIVNFSVVFGSRFAGVPGAAVALFGLMAPPTAIVIVMGMLYAHYGETRVIHGALAGIAASAAGLIISVVIKMAEPIFRKGFGLAPAVAIIAFVTVGLLRWSLIDVLLVLAPLSVAASYWLLRR